MTTKSLARLISIAFLILFGEAAGVFAQAPAASATPSCPNINVSSPDSVKAGGNLTMTVNVSGGDPNVTPTYNWTVSAGEILEGQGTSTITIVTTGFKENTPVTGSVDVGGYDRSCSTFQSSTTMITAGAVARKYDEFIGVSTKDMNNRLGTFAIELEGEPKTTGYIIVYGGRTSAPDAWQKIAAAAKTYLTKNRKIDAARIVTVSGGYREEAAGELWLVPEGATPPAASPTLDASDVTPAKKAPAKKVKIGKS